MKTLELGDPSPVRGTFPVVPVQPWSYDAEPGGSGSAVSSDQFTIIPVPGEAKITVLPGTVNLMMADIGGVLLDASTPPELAVMDGPVWVEILYSGSSTTSATIKNGATMPANIAGVMPRRVQIGTVEVTGTTVTVTAQILKGPIAQYPATPPFRLTGWVDPSGPTAKIFIAPGLIGRQVPKIAGTSVNAQPPPFITVTGTTGLIELRATLDGGGRVTALDAANVATPTADTDTYKYITAGSWTASGGEFTSVESLLTDNYSLFVCNGVVLLEA